MSLFLLYVSFIVSGRVYPSALRNNMADSILSISNNALAEGNIKRDVFRDPFGNDRRHT